MMETGFIFIWSFSFLETFTSKKHLNCLKNPVESVHKSHILSHLHIGLIRVFLNEQLTHSVIQSLAYIANLAKYDLKWAKNQKGYDHQSLSVQGS